MKNVIISMYKNASTIHTPEISTNENNVPDPENNIQPVTLKNILPNHT